jgi:antirestriction protein ArdC
MQINYVTQNEYSGKNQDHLTAQYEDKSFKSNQWGTFMQFKSANRMVQKGEKGVRICKPVKKFLKDGESVLLDKKGKEKTTNVLKKYSVFNLEQTKELEVKEVKETFNIMSIDTLK